MNLSDCFEAERVLANGYFLATQFVVVVLNVSGTMLCAYTTALIVLSQVLHINLRILLLNLSAIICLRTALTLNRSAVNIVVGFSYKNNCELLKEAGWCSSYSAITAAPFESLVFAFTAIAFERCLATLVYKRYEKWKFPFVAIILAPFTWINIALIIHTSISKHASNNVSVSYRPYCSTVTTGYVDFGKLFSYSIPVIIASFMLFVAVYVICRRKLRLFLASKVDDLSSRYQLVENTKSTKVLAILSSMYTLLVLSTLSTVVAISYLKITDLALFAIIKEVSSFSMPIYVNFYPLLFLSLYEHIRDRAVRMFTSHGCRDRKCETTVGPTMSAKEHIHMLEQMWITKR